MKIEPNNKSKKYMWLYRTGTYIKPVILYDYQKTRSGSCPKKFLEGFTGYLQTDGYNGYRMNKEFWGKHLWSRGYFASSSGNITDEVIVEYIKNQDKEENQRSDNFTLERF